MIFPVSGVLLLPWLNPLASGPSPAVVPLLVSIACAAVLVACRPVAAGPRMGAAAGWLPALGVGAWLLVACIGALGFAGHEGVGLLAALATVLAAAWYASAPAAAPSWLASAWLAAALLSSVAALLQYFQLAHVFAPWINTAAAGEAYANLRQRNQFASLTAIGLVALGWLVAQGYLRRLAVPAAVLLALGTAASASRTGLLQLLVLALLAGWWSRGWRAAPVRLMGWALLAYAVATPGLPWLLDATGRGHADSAFWRLTQDVGCHSRSVLWANVLELTAWQPWTGWGWGELDRAHYLTLVDGPRFCDILDNAHNLPLHLAVELGVPAAVLLLGAVGWAVLRARPWRERDATRQMAWGVLLVIGLHSLLEYPLWYGPFQMAAGLALGLLLRPAVPQTPVYVQKVPMVSATQAFIASVMIACVAYAAWDYRRISQVYLAADARAPAYREHTLEQAQASWLFRQQVAFATLTTTDLRPANAAAVYAQAQAVLHYSPEARVVEKLIESAVMLGRDDEALAHLARFRAAYPDAYATWVAGNHTLPGAVRATAQP